MGILGNLVKSQQVTGLGIINQLVTVFRNRALDTKISPIDIVTLLSPALQVRVKAPELDMIRSLCPGPVK